MCARSHTWNLLPSVTYRFHADNVMRVPMARKSACKLDSSWAVAIGGAYARVVRVRRFFRTKTFLQRSSVNLHEIFKM